LLSKYPGVAVCDATEA